ncbi:SIS domain-containing protein [Deinococcus lacus]|uniref:SIS domain-containing protein n=1 Tax=Deinococcus lacus TaxID=392561 RepID=A0ABW1YC31_9DEIO
MNLLTQLEQLPGSYAGPTRPEAAPYGVVGAGEGVLAAALAQTLIPGNLTHSGTQFVVSSTDAQPLAQDYASLAEVAGAQVRRIGVGTAAGDMDALVPGGVGGTYHAAQLLAYASGHQAEAEEAERLLTEIRERCQPSVTENNPARDLAWTLWNRTPLLLASADAEALLQAWQSLLARVGKTLAVPVVGDPLVVLTGAFEARHEKGDAKVGLLLGDLDPALDISREVLESRVDEVHHLPYPASNLASAYPQQLALWYLGAWVAAYLAECYGTPPEDSPVLRRAQDAVTSGTPEGASGVSHLRMEG